MSESKNLLFHSESEGVSFKDWLPSVRMALRTAKVFEAVTKEDADEEAKEHAHDIIMHHLRGEARDQFEIYRFEAETPENKNPLMVAWRKFVDLYKTLGSKSYLELEAKVYRLDSSDFKQYLKEVNQLFHEIKATNVENYNGERLIQEIYHNMPPEVRAECEFKTAEKAKTLTPQKGLKVFEKILEGKKASC